MGPHVLPQVLASVLAREVARLQDDHLASSPDARWPLLTVTRLREAQAKLGLGDAPREELMASVSAAYRRLMELDPLRRGFYQDALEGKSFVGVHALGTV